MSGFATPENPQLARLRGQQQRPRARPSGVSAGSSSSNGYPLTPGSVYRTPAGAGGTPDESGSDNDVFSTPTRVKSGGRSSITATPSSARRPGRVRIVKQQKSWKQRILDVPFELWDRYELSWSEALNLDSDLIGDAAYPAGAACLALHVLLRLSLSASDAITSSSSGLRGSSKLANTAEQRLEELRRASSGSLGRLARGRGIIYTLAKSASWLLMLSSIANALWLFSRRRKYTMFLRQDPIDSPNARTLQVDPSQEKEKEQPLWKKAFNHIKYMALGDSSRSRSTQQQIQELSVWTPPTPSLRFFAIYSPPLALFIQFLDRSNAVPFLFASLFLSVQTWYLIRIYAQTLSDRQSLNREVMHEYDAKFVNPRINYSRREIGVQTHQAEFVDRDEWMHPSSMASGNTSARKSLGNGLSRMPRSSTSSALGRGY